MSRYHYPYRECRTKEDKLSLLCWSAPIGSAAPAYALAGNQQLGTDLRLVGAGAKGDQRTNKEAFKTGKSPVQITAQTT